MKNFLSNKWYVTVFVAPGLILFLVMAVIPLFTTGYYGLFNYMMELDKKFYRVKELQKNCLQRTHISSEPFELHFISAAGSFVYSDSDCIISRLLFWQIELRAKVFIRTVFFLPVVISSMVIGQLWCKIFNSEGLLNAILGALGMANDTAWLVYPKSSLYDNRYPRNLAEYWISYGNSLCRN